MTTVVAGFLLGCAGSAHCAAMCGPLILLFGRSGTTSGRIAIHAAAYHAARIVMYLCIGMAATAVGEMTYVAGIGRGVAVLVGLALLFHSGLRLGGIPFSGLVRCSDMLTRALVRISGRTAAVRKNGTLPGACLTGAINGLLPCGLVYAAAAASASGGWAMSATFMASFGGGTLPILVVLAVTGHSLSAATRSAFQRFSPLAVAAVGLLVLIRAVAVEAALGLHHHMHLP